MFTQQFKNLGIALLALAALVIASFSAVPAFAQQPTGTPTPAAATTESATTTPTVQARTGRQGTQPAGATNVLGGLRRLGFTAGVVTENSGDSLTVQVGRTSHQLKIGNNTLVVVPGIKNAQGRDIKVRDRVFADLRGSDNSVPSLILDVPQGYTANNVMIGRVVLNVRGGVILRTRNGLQDIVPEATTVVVNMLEKQPALGTIKDARRGDAVIVIGKRNGDLFNPQVILVLKGDALPGARRQSQPASTPTP